MEGVLASGVGELARRPGSRAVGCGGWEVGCVWVEGGKTEGREREMGVFVKKRRENAKKKQE